MVENGFAEHPRKYPKAAQQLQRRTGQDSSTQRRREEATSKNPRPARDLLLRGQILFLNGSNHDVVWINHLGEVDFADFRKQLVRVEFRKAVFGVNPANQLGEG